MDTLASLNTNQIIRCIINIFPQHSIIVVTKTSGAGKLSQYRAGRPGFDSSWG